MDLTFITGIGAVVSAVLIFCGSMWLLLSMVTGARLAYFVTASITLAFLLIMGVAWSINPLGPVGALPEWIPVGIGQDAGQVEGSAGYPGGPWEEPPEDDPVEAARASELESAASDYLQRQIDRGEISAYAAAADVTTVEDSTRLRTEDGTELGALALEADPAKVEAGAVKDKGEVIVVMRYDPKNPLGPSRMMTAGTFLLLVGHLFGLSRAEKKARAAAEPSEGSA